MTNSETENPEFRLEFDPAHGEAVPIADGVQRITATNGGPFTFHGTNTYIVGHKNVAVIDPGPHDEAHLKDQPSIDHPVVGWSPHFCP